jgi:uncharacterized membrane protein
MSIDEKFTNIADKVTETVGRWFFTVISFMLLMIWILYGMLFIANWFTSATWNFPLNTITTVGEWFMEGLILAAANRVERRNNMLLEKIESLAEKIEAEESQEVAELVQIDQRLQGK